MTCFLNSKALSHFLILLQLLPSIWMELLTTPIKLESLIEEKADALSKNDDDIKRGMKFDLKMFRMYKNALKGMLYSAFPNPASQFVRNFESRAKIFKIDGNGHTETILEDTQLSLDLCKSPVRRRWKFLGGLAYLRSETNGKTNWLYPLLPDIASYQQAKNGAFIFPDIESAQNYESSAFGIILKGASLQYIKHFKELLDTFLPAKVPNDSVERNNRSAIDFESILQPNQTDVLVLNSVNPVISHTPPASSVNRLPTLHEQQSWNALRTLRDSTGNSTTWTAGKVERNTNNIGVISGTNDHIPDLKSVINGYSNGFVVKIPNFNMDDFQVRVV